MNSSNIIFIVSLPRSGSTMLQAILSNNDEVATCSEPWILLPFLSYDRDDLNNAVYSTKLSNIGIQSFKDKIGSEGFNTDLSRFILSQYQKLIDNNEKWVLDKTPRYYEILNEIEAYFPESKIIIIKRNPIAVLNSMIKKRNIKDFYELQKNERDLLYGPSILESFIKQGYKNVYTVQYESLLENPIEEVQAIYSWIGLESFSKEVLDYAVNDKFKGPLGDQKSVHQFRKPSFEQTNAWKEIYLNSDWGDFARGYAKYLGEDFLSKYGDYKGVEYSDSPKFNQFLAFLGGVKNEVTSEYSSRISLFSRLKRKK